MRRTKYYCLFLFAQYSFICYIVVKQNEESNDERFGGITSIAPSRSMSGRVSSSRSSSSQHFAQQHTRWGRRDEKRTFCERISGARDEKRTFFYRVCALTSLITGPDGTFSIAIRSLPCAPHTQGTAHARSNERRVRFFANTKKSNKNIISQDSGHPHQHSLLPIRSAERTMTHRQQRLAQPDVV